MSGNVSLVFDVLESRAKALDPECRFDRISLRDHIQNVEIGAFQSERENKQRIQFDVVVEVAPSDAAATDDVDDILSYDTITEAIAYELAAERLNLLETLAERVASRILLSPAAERVFVRIQKLDRGPGALGVEIVRAKDAGTSIDMQLDEPPAVLILALSRAAQKSAHLPFWLQQIRDMQLPALLVPEIDSAKIAGRGDNHLHRRLTLLDYERAGLVLAAQSDFVSVIGTKTELDHAARTTQISLWAPSKLVLDAVNAPKDLTLEHLVLWVKDHVRSCGVLSIGGSGAHVHAPDQRDIDFSFLGAN